MANRMFTAGSAAGNPADVTHAAGPAGRNATYMTETGPGYLARAR